MDELLGILREVVGSIVRRENLSVRRIQAGAVRI